MNRKLIRPNFTEIKEQMGRAPKPAAMDMTPVASTPAELAGTASNPNAALVPQGTGSPRRKILMPYLLGGFVLSALALPLGHFTILRVARKLRARPSHS